MLKTIHVANYEGQLDETLNKTLAEKNITRENLISIEYSTRVHRIIPTTKSKLLDIWFSSALIIYEEQEESV